MSGRSTRRSGGGVGARRMGGGAGAQEHMVVVESTPRGKIVRASRMPAGKQEASPEVKQAAAKLTTLSSKRPTIVRPHQARHSAPKVVTVEVDDEDEDLPPRIEPEVAPPSAKRPKVVGGSLRPTFGTATLAGRGSRHITVEAPALQSSGRPYVENPLPGVADEVESYPCRYCPDRVFLTSFGLERHTKLCHPEQLQTVLDEIARIQDEWKRRETEREKQRERMALAKIRQEALAAAAAREAAFTEESTGKEQPTSSDWSSTAEPEQRHQRGGEQRSSNFESCRICGLLINAFHPTAMENHMRAHKKNDELRAHLLNAYGPEFVARVTCHECQLVFTDERKLIAHAEAMHVRRRKYVCKWCGHVCMTMTELNNHKADIHGMPVSRSRDPEVRRQRQLTSLTRGHGMPPPLGVQSAATRRAVAIAEAARMQQGVSQRVLTSVEELPCRTTCDLCGLIMVKPSLLIRHMMRVHNRTSFTATVETKGMPPFKVTVDQGKLSWSCCEESYSDRNAFINHRRHSHQPKMAHPGATALSTRPMVFDSGQQQQQEDTTDEQYVLVMVEGADESKDATKQEGQQQIVLTPEQLQQLGISAEDGENMMVLMDDGSGNLSTADGTQVVLEEGQEQLMLVGDKEATQNPEDAQGEESVPQEAPETDDQQETEETPQE